MKKWRVYTVMLIALIMSTACFATLIIYSPYKEVRDISVIGFLSNLSVLGCIYSVAAMQWQDFWK